MHFNILMLDYMQHFEKERETMSSVPENKSLLAPDDEYTRIQFAAALDDLRAELETQPFRNRRQLRRLDRVAKDEKKFERVFQFARQQAMESDTPILDWLRDGGFESLLAFIAGLIKLFAVFLIAICIGGIANAQYGSNGSSYGYSYGSNGSSYQSYGYGSNGSSFTRRRPIRNMLNRFAQRRIERINRNMARRNANYGSNGSGYQTSYGYYYQNVPVTTGQFIPANPGTIEYPTFETYQNCPNGMCPLPPITQVIRRSAVPQIVQSVSSPEKPTEFVCRKPTPRKTSPDSTTTINKAEFVCLSPAKLNNSGSSSGKYEAIWVINDGKTVTQHLLDGFPGQHTALPKSVIDDLSVENQYRLHDWIHDSKNDWL